jgi:hypothetical protein
MTIEETRKFAFRAVNHAASGVVAEMGPHRRAALWHVFEMELTPRGALTHQITLIVRAVLHTVDHTQSLTEARHILAAGWLDVLDRCEEGRGQKVTERYRKRRASPARRFRARRKIAARKKGTSP